MTTIGEKRAHIDSCQEALRAVIEVLKGLDEEAQRRVLQTAAVFYEIHPRLDAAVVQNLRQGNFTRSETMSNVGECT